MRANRLPVIAWLLVRLRFDFNWACTFFSRVLLVVAAIELITMPLTQYLWTWDHFLHGGRDFEMGLLMIMTFLCFGMLRAQCGGQHLESLFAVGVSHAVVVRQREHRRMLQAPRRSSEDLLDHSPGNPPPLCCLPLLI